MLSARFSPEADRRPLHAPGDMPGGSPFDDAEPPDLLADLIAPGPRPGDSSPDILAAHLEAAADQLDDVERALHTAEQALRSTADAAVGSPAGSPEAAAAAPAPSAPATATSALPAPPPELAPAVAPLDPSVLAGLPGGLPAGMRALPPDVVTLDGADADDEAAAAMPPPAATHSLGAMMAPAAAPAPDAVAAEASAAPDDAMVAVAAPDASAVESPAPAAALATVAPEPAAPPAAPAEPTDAASVVVRYLPEVTSFCFSRTGDWAMAEEAAQETMVNVIRAEARCPFASGPEAVRDWVLEIARAVCVDVLRRRAVASQDAIDPRERLERRSRERTTSSPSMARPVSYRPVEERGPRLVAALQEPARSVVKLRVWDQRSFGEIAEALGKTAEAVAGLYGEALRDLEAMLVAEEGVAGGRG